MRHSCVDSLFHLFIHPIGSDVQYSGVKCAKCATWSQMRHFTLVSIRFFTRSYIPLVRTFNILESNAPLSSGAAIFFFVLGCLSRVSSHPLIHISSHFSFHHSHASLMGRFPRHSLIHIIDSKKLNSEVKFPGCRFSARHVYGQWGSLSGQLIV